MSSEAYHVSLRDVDPIQFEQFIAELWTHRGWNTTLSSESGDKGIDVIATRDEPFSQKQLIQVKRYGEENTVGSPEIQQYGSLKHQEPGVDTVVVVTTSQFSSQAEELAEQLNVKLIDGKGLSKLIEQLGATDLVQKYVENVEERGTGLSDEDSSEKVDSGEDEMGTGEAIIAVTQLLLILGVIGYVLYSIGGILLI